MTRKIKEIKGQKEQLENHEYDFIDDDDSLEISIEINEDDFNISDNDESVDSDDVENDKSVEISKHKSEGKHSLKYDSIFKGKKEEPVSEDGPDNISTFVKDNIEIDKTSSYYKQSVDYEAYIREKKVKEKVYDVLKNKTSLSFTSNRRKPSRIDFNKYYRLIKKELNDENFTNVELFNELSVYFSDNLFNMFKLLDNKWRTSIIDELQEHIGKGSNSKDVTNRNIYEGTEIEFLVVENSISKLITGVVLETNYEDSTYRVDSYENKYDVDLEDITKILNNTKYKYNLNKLDHIDFL